MTYNPTLVGDTSEAMVLAALLRAQKKVLRPFGFNSRYDLLVEEGEGEFVRVQCKTGRLKSNGATLVFNVCSTSGTTRDYKGQIEVFGVYSPDLDKVFLVPVEVVGKSEAVLRIRPPANGSKGVRYASDFELVPVPMGSIREVSQKTREKLRTAALASRAKTRV